MSKDLIKAKMYDKDAFSQWLGIHLDEVSESYCKLSMKVRAEMLNGFHIAHGAITYALADSALAFASNSNGNQAVSIETSISHMSMVSEGDTLTAETSLISKTRKFARYRVSVTNQDEKQVASFNGTVFYTGKLL